MPTYRAKFYGRTKGAIGIFHTISTTVTAPNKDKAHLKLYDRYDHIQRLVLVEVKTKKKTR